MDEDIKRDQGAKTGEKPYSSGRASMAARAAEDSALRSLAAPSREGVGASQAGPGSSGSSQESNTANTVANTAIDTRGRQEIAPDIAPDAETRARGTKAPVVFRQVTVEKQSPASALGKESGRTGLSNGAAATETAKGPTDNLDATRLLNVEQLARAFSKPPRERTEVDAAPTQTARLQPDPASSGENDWPQFQGSLPRFARDDESTQFFHLSVPKNGPIRAEPANNRGQTDGSPDSAVPSSVSWSMGRLPAAKVSSPSVESNGHGDRDAHGAIQESMPARHPTPQPAQGPQALVPGLVMLNLLLTLLSLAAIACLAFYVLTAGR